MQSLPTLVRTARQTNADRMLSTGAVVGAAVLLSCALASGALTWYSNMNVSPARWQGPPPSAFDVLPVASGAVVAVAAVVLLALRLGRTATAACAAAAAAAPAAASAVLAPQPSGEYYGYPFTMGEVAGILLILAVAAYRCGPLAIAGITAVAMSALTSDVLRNPDHLPQSSDGLFTNAALAVLVGIAPGVYLRWRAEQRRSQVAQARQEERLAVARDLHDEVAHQITGIVVQAQALRHIAGSAPDRAQAALPEIEKSAAQALASMRRLVAALRVAEEAPAVDGRDPAAALRDLEQPSGPRSTRVDVTVSGPVQDLPSDVGAALVRIAQEAVTNALRHARDATRVSVSAAAGA